MTENKTHQKFEVRIHNQSDRFRLVTTNNRIMAGNVASFAMDLIKVSQAVATTPDGETSTGHPKFRMLTPKESVDRAIEIAEIAYDCFMERGWAATSPSLDELRDESSTLGFRTTEKAD